MAPGPGIISERDVLVSIGRGQDPDSERVGDHMSDSVITANPDWSLERAAADMASRGIRHLVIVEGPEVVGVLSMRDIMRVWTSDRRHVAMTSWMTHSRLRSAANRLRRDDGGVCLLLAAHP